MWTWKASNGNWIVAESAIVDSSPLIFLSKADSLDFLRLASEILVPESVAQEIHRRRPEVYGKGSGGNRVTVAIRA